MQNPHKFFKDLLQIILNTYSQIFFSTQKEFAALILLVTFFDFYTGLFGLLAVLATIVTGFCLGFDRKVLDKGLLGFNSLLVGLGLGVYFSPSIYLAFIVVLASLFAFFISVSLQGVIGKYGLPFLSIPFIIALWVFMLATTSFHVLGINERGIFTINELYHLGGQSLVNVYDYLNIMEIPKVLRAYFISLSAILFQYNVLSGMIISLGLLLFSRIAFSLSLIGFFLAYYFYQIIGAQITIYDYSFFGFNYILSSIALGGFFLIPSRKAYLWMILLIPFVAILTISMNMLFLQFRLPVYSLPFNMVALLFIYSLKFREKYSYHLSEVYFQYNSPEKNLYIFQNNKERFRYRFFTPIKLPFYGKWKVSQGQNGTYTHQGVYQYAWDFNIEGFDGRQFQNQGDYHEDYYCFGKPVIAPEKGIVESVIDGIEDNLIGKANLKDNWGNTIIIKHENQIYTKLSHLKKASILVKKGEEVQFGQVIAKCGNSGRSPYPHLHFQIQSYPFIGSQTLDYPLNSFIAEENGSNHLYMHSKPVEDQVVSNIEVNPLLASALEFIPGQALKFEVDDHGKKDSLEWKVEVDEYNQSFIYDSKTGAKAYFENDATIFQFTYFEGDKKSYLYQMFIALFKVQKGYYQDLKLKDQFPVYLTFPKKILWFHDFISPFIMLVKSKYNLNYQSIDDELSPSEIILQSSMINYLMKRKINESRYKIILDSHGVLSLQVRSKNGGLTIKR
jgi:urea transporter